MAVYNGLDKLIWRDVWIEDKPLLCLALDGVLPSHAENTLATIQSS